jgi:hypothetical protein
MATKVSTMTDIPMTHAVLVGRAVRWLRNTMRCQAVLREFHCATDEIPDAIGWRYARAIVVECKTSVADYYADRQKPAFRAGRLIGWKRYYLTRVGLIDPVANTLPSGFGLLEYDGRIVNVRVQAQPREVDRHEEVRILLSIARRAEKRVGDLQQFVTEYVSVAPIALR